MQLSQLSHFQAVSSGCIICQECQVLRRQTSGVRSVGVNVLLVYPEWSGQACQIKGYLSRNLNKVREWVMGIWAKKSPGRGNRARPWGRSITRDHGGVDKAMTKGQRAGEKVFSSMSCKGLCIKVLRAVLGTQQVLNKWELWLWWLLSLFLS